MYVPIARSASTQAPISFSQGDPGLSHGKTPAQLAARFCQRNYLGRELESLDFCLTMELRANYTVDDPFTPIYKQIHTSKKAY